MANAQFIWTIEDVQAPVRRNWTNTTVNSPMTVKNTDGTSTNVAETVTLLYAILDVWNGSVLYLNTLNWNGNCELKIKVFAREAVEIDEDVSADESVSLTTVTWIEGEEIKKARKRCNPFYAEVNDSFWYLTEKLSDIKNRPDPPSERGAREIARAVEQVQMAVARHSEAGGQRKGEGWGQLGISGELRSVGPVPAGVNFSRLRLPNVAPAPGTLKDKTRS